MKQENVTSRRNLGVKEDVPAIADDTSKPTSKVASEVDFEDSPPSKAELRKISSKMN